MAAYDCIVIGSGPGGYVAAILAAQVGMNTAVVNASDQLIFSISTAKTSPIAVIVAGTTATQIALFLIAVVIVNVVKSAL